jgi:hypothetical protein
VKAISLGWCHCPAAMIRPQTRTRPQRGPSVAVRGNQRLRRPPLTLPAADDPRLARACEAVVNDLSQPFTIIWLARHADVSVRTLTSSSVPSSA